MSDELKQTDYRDSLIKAVEEVEKELFRAKSIHKNDFVNHHEGYAVILEELEELWDEIKINPSKENYSIYKIRTEAVQTCAMLLRFICELT